LNFANTWVQYVFSKNLNYILDGKQIMNNIIEFYSKYLFFSLLREESKFFNANIE